MWSFGTTMTMARDSDPSHKSADSKTPSSTPTSMPSPVPAPQESVVQPVTRAPITSERSLKQLGLFFAGAGFLALSTLITRRAISRKIGVTRPQFYTQSNRPVQKINSDNSLVAVEALSLATLNVLGFGIMATGGLAWAFDVSNLDDLRSMARRHVGPPGGQTDEEAEREVEEWVAKILLRKEHQEQETNSSPKKDN
ncbi:hypothetical protein F4780DRAFT_466496 [Xylariomycetidae sp. FL0641]|nr:hypothetical protein F4780DRAFT_466496 [Xylariomycetidae sp. FL0641]